MSKFVNEIIKDIKNNPQTWSRHCENGLRKDNIIISDCGNGSWWFFGWITSIVDVSINGRGTFSQTTWIDKFRLEQAFLWWIRNASVSMLQ